MSGVQSASGGEDPGPGAGQVEVDLVSAERRLFKGASTGVYARSVEGQIGILPGHQPLLIQLEPAPLAIDTPEGREVFAVHGGFLEYRGERLTILADGADRADEIDVTEAEEQVRVARERHAESDATEETRHQLRVAQMRLELAQG